MKPLSRKKRTLYFILSACILLVTAPLVVFYSMGYRFDTILGLGQVGGIYTTAPMNEVDFSLNDKPLGRSSFFKRSALFQDIRPGVYKFSATKNGYYGWHKNVTVLAENVAELHPFMLPDKPVLTLVPKDLPVETPAATTSKTETVKQEPKANPLYKDVAALFVAAPIVKPVIVKDTSTIDPESTKKVAIPGMVSKDKIDIWYEGGKIFARWNGQIEYAPIFFCSELTCSKEILVYTNSTPITHLDFLPSRNDVVLFSSKNGVYALEADRVSPQNIQPLYAKGADFRIAEDGTIYIKDDKDFYAYEL